MKKVLIALLLMVLFIPNAKADMISNIDDNIDIENIVSETTKYYKTIYYNNTPVTIKIASKVCSTGVLVNMRAGTWHIINHAYNGKPFIQDGMVN